MLFGKRNDAKKLDLLNTAEKEKEPEILKSYCKGKEPGYVILELMVNMGLADCLKKPILTIEEDGGFCGSNVIINAKSVNLLQQRHVETYSGGREFSNIRGHLNLDGTITVKELAPFALYSGNDEINEDLGIQNNALFLAASYLQSTINVKQLLKAEAAELLKLNSKLRYDRKVTIERLKELVEQIRKINICDTFGSVVITKPISDAELYRVLQATKGTNGKSIPVFIGQQKNGFVEFNSVVSLARAESIGTAMGETLIFRENETARVMGARVKKAA